MRARQGREVLACDLMRHEATSRRLQEARPLDLAAEGMRGRQWELKRTVASSCVLDHVEMF
jgi:hypothetical protein